VGFGGCRSAKPPPEIGLKPQIGLARLNILVTCRISHAFCVCGDTCFASLFRLAKSPSDVPSVAALRLDRAEVQLGVKSDGSTLQKEHQMSSNIYVGNLTFNTSSSDLESLFAQHGTVTSAQVVNDRETGRSRGFGFVEMSSSDEANAAIEALNGRNVDGRDLTVNVAKPRR